MIRHRFALLPAVILTATLFAQPVPEEAAAPIPTPFFVPVPERAATRPVLEVAPNSNLPGTNGEVVLDAVPSPYTTGALFRAFSSTPNMFLKLGSSSSTAALDVMNSADALLLRIRGNGNTTVGASNELARLATINYTDAGRSLYAYQSAQVETTIEQHDYAILTDAINTVATGAKNTGSVVGIQAQGWNNGAGNVANVFGGRFIAGQTASGTGTVDSVTGLHVIVTAGGGTNTNGYGLVLNDVQSTNGYGVYQSGTNDTNFFGGPVGIGNSAPAYPLSVRRGGTNNFNAEFTTDSSADGGLLLGRTGTNGAAITMRTATDDYLAFAVKKGSSVAFTETPDMVIRHDGKVGIGISNPLYALHVQGDIYANGVFNAVYQDVAEWVPATADLQPGTVVVLNPEAVNQVMPSSTSYDTMVAGVVSAQPGLLLGVAGAEKERVATTGRVKVRVDASSAPIRVGDLLVTSNQPGTAMRSVPIEVGGHSIHRPGTIIGKALEPLATGAGEILVLLSMQ